MRHSRVKFLATRVLFIRIPQFSMLSYVNTIAKYSSSFLQLRNSNLVLYFHPRNVFIPVLLLFILFLPLLNSVSLEFHRDIA